MDSLPNKTFRMLWIMLASSVFILAGLKISLWLRAPHVYEGDRMEVRQCRECGGKGKDAELAKDNPGMSDQCPFCKGAGTVNVLIPGPNHTVRVSGVLVDEAKTSPEDEYTHWMVDRSGENPLNPAPRAGVINGGRVTFDGKDRSESETGEHGLITAELAPGTYTVSATKDGYSETRGTLTVKPLTEPIWLEEAHMVREPGTQSQAIGFYGIQLLVTMSKPGAASGRLVQSMESVPIH